MTNNSSHAIGNKAYLIESPLFLNGITRAGKFILGKVMSNIKDVEYFQYASILEHLPFLCRLGLISQEVASTLMRIHLDEHAYNMAIGRNLNFRFDDASSIYHSAEMNQYKQRSLEKNIPELLKAHKVRIPCFIIHESLPSMNVVFDTFPKAWVIDLQRHPVDLIHSWYVRGWGHRQLEDPLSFLPVLQGNGASIPWYASTWKDEYEKANRMDRVIGSIDYLVTEGEKTYQTLSANSKSRICRISYEGLILEPQKTAKTIGQFLDRPVQESLVVTMAREKLPNLSFAKDRPRKLNEIEKEATPDFLKKLNALIKNYEQAFQS